MKVLVLHSELGVLRGGGENFSRNLFSAFAQRGHHVAAAFVADRRGRYPLALPPVIEPIPIHGWWSNNFGQATLSDIGRLFSPRGKYRKKWDHIQAAIGWRVFSWHKRRFQRRVAERFAKVWVEYDAIYVHGDALLANMVARYRLTVLRLPGPVTSELEPMLRGVDAVCANGDALNSIRQFLGSHVTELPVGIDSLLFQPGPSEIRSALGWQGSRVVGYVGRLTHVKGIDILAKAFRDAISRVPDLRLLVIGSGEESYSVRALLAREFAKGAVHLEPDVSHENLVNWYRAMDLLIMPSRYENFSNSLLEGMACGLPFLASGVGGNKIMAQSGAGWLFDPGSVDSLSAQLTNVTINGSELKRRGQCGFDYVRSHHSWLATAERLEQIFLSRGGADA
jgi:glycosyltransferase involved in cell wall biosynthesis